MLKIPRKVSIILSMIIAVAFFIVCLFCAVIMPKLVEALINLPDNIGNRGTITDPERVLCLVLAYGILGVTTLAVIMMFLLLIRVYRGNVFTARSVVYIRGVSWCWFLLCLFFGVLGNYFQLSIIVALAAVFLGLSLRVVKNVIEEATEIKMENDLTV